MAKTTEKKTEKPKKTIGKVVNGALNVRSDAKPSAEIVKVLENGAKIEILGEKGEFYKVKDGFCMKKFVEVEK